MTIDPLQAGALPSAAPASTGSAGMLGGLGTEGFLQLLVAQLRYQNPLSPSDPSAMLQQTAQLAQVETLGTLAENQQQLVALQQTSIATGLIGKDVSAVVDGDRAVTGTVEAVRFDTGGPVLVVDGEHVPLSEARELRTTDAVTDHTTT